MSSHRFAKLGTTRRQAPRASFATPLRGGRILAVITLLLLAVAPAAAEDDKKAEAEKYFRAGENAYNTGQYLVAAQAFEEAYELLPVPAIAFSTAQAYRLLYVTDKQPAYVKRAVELYRTYVQQVKEGGRVPDATSSLAELEPVLERLEREGKSMAMPIQAPRTQLMISSQVSPARGEVAGKSGPLPLIVEVAAGEYQVKADADGYYPVDIKATAVEGEFIVVEVDLLPRPAILDVEAEEGARVEVDGRPVGSTPLARPIEVPAGKHFVAITRRGRRAYSREIDARRGETVKIEAGLRATGQRKAVPWVWGGALVLGLAAGAAGGWALVEQGKASDLDDKRRTESITAEELDQYLEHRQNRDDATRAMWAFAGASVVTATIGTLMYLFDRPEAEAPPPTFMPAPDSPAVSPFATEGGAGISIAGSF
jgi:tetratricopeptide (TPR) repeat protein